VYALEPGTVAGDFLERNVQENRLGNVTVEHLGAYDETTTLSLHVDASNPGGAHLSVTDAQEEDAETIRLTRIDDWVAANGIDRVDVVKMDIEGAEVQALRGAAETLRRFRPVVVV